jgi:hypothetical protein
LHVFKLLTFGNISPHMSLFSTVYSKTALERGYCTHGRMDVLGMYVYVRIFWDESGKPNLQHEVRIPAKIP